MPFKPIIKTPEEIKVLRETDVLRNALAAATATIETDPDGTIYEVKTVTIRLPINSAEIAAQKQAKLEEAARLEAEAAKKREEAALLESKEQVVAQEEAKAQPATDLEPDVVEETAVEPA